MMAGARPVFADIDPDRLTIDPSAVAAAVTPRTKALLPVHLYGQPADMPRLMSIADRHHLSVVEDCCQAHLATCERAACRILRACGGLQLLSDQEPGRSRRWRCGHDGRSEDRRTRATASQRRTNRSVSPRRVRRELPPRRDAGGNPPCSVVLAFTMERGASSAGSGIPPAV